MAQFGEVDLRNRGVASHLEVSADPSIAAVILSAGESRRMGSPKALLKLDSETFLDRLIGMFSSFAHPVVVVLGPQGASIRTGIRRAAEVVFALNPNPELGMLTSLQAGLREIPAAADGVLFTPVDYAHVERSSITQIIDTFRRTQAPVTVPTFGAEHGHPVCIARPLVAELLALPPSSQARDVIHRHAAQTSYVEVNDPGILTDVDDPGAYAELLAHRSARVRPS